MDAQSVKRAIAHGIKAMDAMYAGKKVSGIKRHITVDTQSLSHAIIVTTADVGDHLGALAMLQGNEEKLAEAKAVLRDGGYTGKPFARGGGRSARQGSGSEDSQTQRVA